MRSKESPGNFILKSYLGDSSDPIMIVKYVDHLQSAS